MTDENKIDDEDLTEDKDIDSGEEGTDGTEGSGADTDSGDGTDIDDPVDESQDEPQAVAPSKKKPTLAEMRQSTIKQQAHAAKIVEEQKDK